MRNYFSYDLWVNLLTGLMVGLMVLLTQYIFQIGSHHLATVSGLDFIKNVAGILTTILVFNRYVSLRGVELKKAVLIMFVSESIYLLIEGILIYLILTENDEVKLLKLMTFITILGMGFQHLMAELHRQFKDYFIKDVRYKDFLTIIRRKTAIIPKLVGTATTLFMYIMTEYYEFQAIDFFHICWVLTIILVIGLLINNWKLYRWYKGI